MSSTEFNYKPLDDIHFMAVNDDNPGESQLALSLYMTRLLPCMESRHLDESQLVAISIETLFISKQGS